MRIAIEATIAQRKFLTGFGHYVLNLLKGLGRIAPENEYILLHSSEEWTGPDFGPQFTTVSYMKNGSPMKILMNINNVLRAAKADLFHATCTTGLPPDPPITCVATIHDVYPLLYPHEAFSPPTSLYKLLVQLSIDGSKRIIANSDFTANELHKTYGMSKEKMDIVYPSFALPERLLSWPQGHPSDSYILCVGAIERRKGQLLLMEAYRRVCERKSRAPNLLFIGPDRGDGEQLKKMIDCFELNDKVTWLKYVNDMPLAAYYRSASFFAFTSTYEGFGVPLIEAMASGLPTVCTDIPVFHEIAGDYPIFAKPEPQALADALYKMIQGEGNEHFKTAVRRKYSWDDTARGVLDCYRKALA